MTGLVPVIHVDAAATVLEREHLICSIFIHVRRVNGLRATWMPGTSPGMTTRGVFGVPIANDR